MLTLGVYYFWGKTRIRRYLFGASAFEGDRFAYHGTAQELLLGFAKAFVVFFVPIVVLTVVRDVLDVGPTIKGAAALSISLLFLMFLPVAMVGARRYRLSRTSWRGIRFSFRGAALEFVKIFVKGTILTGLTFGLYYPFFVTRRQAFMISHSYFGNERFDFDGRGRELFGPFLLSVLLTLPTLGLCWVWFLARKRRFFWEHTTFGARPGSARRSRAARCSASGWSMPSCSSVRLASPGRGCGCGISTSPSATSRWTDRSTSSASGSRPSRRPPRARAWPASSTPASTSARAMSSDRVSATGA